MPRRDDLETILLVGSGPIVIGQACEFDYSGTQACRVLRAEGFRVVLVNSNPATIMTDPEFADATYVEPLDVPTLTRIIAKGAHVEHWLNGVKVLDYECGSELVKAAVAASKFKTTPGFGDKIKGHILLQDHHSKVWFRNVKIRELSGS